MEGSPINCLSIFQPEGRELPLYRRQRQALCRRVARQKGKSGIDQLAFTWAAPTAKMWGCLLRAI